MDLPTMHEPLYSPTALERLSDTVFSHIDDLTKITTHINVDALLRDSRYRLRPTKRIKVTVEHSIWILNNRGIEAHRLKSLNELQVTDFKPITLLYWPGGTHLMVDGHHRYVVAAGKGADTITVKFIPESIWRKYVIPGRNASEVELKTVFSNIP